MHTRVAAMFQLLLENNVRVSWTCNFLLATKEVTYRHTVGLRELLLNWLRVL